MGKVHSDVHLLWTDGDGDVDGDDDKHCDDESSAVSLLLLRIVLEDIDMDVAEVDVDDGCISIDVWPILRFVLFHRLLLLLLLGHFEVIVVEEQDVGCSTKEARCAHR